MVRSLARRGSCCFKRGCTFCAALFAAKLWAKWTWYCQPVDGATGSALEPAKPLPLDPLAGETIKLTTSGVYDLHVLCNATHIPSTPKPVPPESADGADGADGAVQSAAQSGPLPDPSRDVPTRVYVSPSALSAVHSTFYGSGMHDRYPDGEAGSPSVAPEREIILIAIVSVFTSNVKRKDKHGKH